MKKKGKQKSSFPDDEDEEDPITAAVNKYKKLYKSPVQEQVRFWETAQELLSKTENLNTVAGLTYTSASPHPTASSYVASTVSLNR